ncbi:helix-turn-helix domain-containing protein [Dactylosporangium sp. CA-092794]|uniref:helix-turn-helix domain-containing protein n=1 Tax=Dactylosporangium sp. CA-092794 TaxID=3239929 RepID=UPI003D8D562F
MSQPSQPDFAHRLKRIRLARGLTQRDVASDSVSVSYVSLLESGRRTPTPDTISALARTLGCSVAELTGEKDHPAEMPTALNVRLGQIALEADDAGLAEEHFASALAAPDLDPLARSDIAIGRARALEAQGRLAEAAAMYESLVREAMHTPAYLASLNVVISWCRCLYEIGELNRVIEIGTGVMRELDRLEAWQSDAAIQLLATVAAAHFELGDIGQSERLLREGMERAERMGSPIARASVLWNSSNLASERGRYREALELAEEALVHFRQASDQRSTARLLNQYGHLLLHQEPPRPVDAKATLEEALAILVECGRGYDRGYVLTELSRAYLMIGDSAAAADAAERSLRELGDEAVLERARAGTALAAALAAEGQHERSTEIFAQAAQTLGQLKASRQAARTWVELANTLMDAGDANGAVQAFRQAAALANLGPPPTAGPSGDLKVVL